MAATFKKIFPSIALECPRLESLTLTFCENITDKGMEFLIKNCKNLKKLDLEGTKSLTSQFLCEIEKNLPKLCYINLTNCLNIGYTSVKEVVRKSKNDMEIVFQQGDCVKRRKICDSGQFDTIVSSANFIDVISTPAL